MSLEELNLKSDKHLCKPLIGWEIQQELSITHGLKLIKTLCTRKSFHLVSNYAVFKMDSKDV
uniref:Uncharacterized protein n=1 Tax=Anguilla anguilla TaxID=7936 RepID=A0A0E9WKN4_ANGAN